MSDELDSKPLTRMVKLGSLAGRVGVSMAGNAVSNTFRSLEGREVNRNRNQIRNAMRVVETVGKMKGVPMKVGQMLSLHEHMMPPEVAEILRSLQQSAPSVPFEHMYESIRSETGHQFQLVGKIDPEPWAAASIGQIHRATLKDGREVVFKVQYPGIDKVIEADMKNMRGLMKLLFSLFTRMDTDPIWEEMNDRMLEELDYLLEADNLQRTAEQTKDHPEIVLPTVIEELTSRHVLCMSFEESLSPDEACSGKYPAELRDQWGQAIFSLVIEGLLQHQLIHADPNLANFGFREDGSLVVYDFGCMKELPAMLSRSYALLARAVIEHRHEDIQETLHKVGVHRVDGPSVSLDMIRDIASIARRPFEDEEGYQFGSDRTLFRDLQSVAMRHWKESMRLTFPKDVVFVDRTLSGHLGNLVRLRSWGPWNRMLLGLIEDLNAVPK